MHESMEITDQFYSNQSDSEVQNRISALGKKEEKKVANQEMAVLIQEFLTWKENRD